MKQRIVYLNGKFVNEEDAKIDVFTHALHYGTGVFEGIRSYYNKKQNAHFIFRMEDHFKRIQKSGKILFINLPHPIKELCDISEKLIQKNFSETDMYIRPLAYKADPSIGNFNLQTLKDGFFIYTIALGRYLDTEKGIRANVSSWTRVSDNAIPPRGKITGSYVNTALAKTESLLLGFDESLVMDRHGHIVEGSAENVFVVHDGVVATPPISDDILQGITRATILMLCKDDLNLQVVERSIDRSSLYTADEVFLVGTGAEVSPVVEIDGRPVGTGKIGPIAKNVKDIYYRLVHGEYPKYSNFFTKVVAHKK